MYNSENLQEKWQPVLSHPDLPEIKDNYKKAVTSIILAGYFATRGKEEVDFDWEEDDEF